MSREVRIKKAPSVVESASPITETTSPEGALTVYTDAAGVATIENRNFSAILGVTQLRAFGIARARPGW
jgi:hypothetical protein